MSGKTAAPCEVCGEWVPHKDSEVVGRRLSGVPRLVHKSCMRRWRVVGPEKMARWLERRSTCEQM